MTGGTTGRPRVLVTADFDPEVADGLGDAFALTVLPPAGGPEPLSERIEAAELAEFEAIVCETDLVDAATVSAGTRLKLVISCRANPVNVDLKACRAAGVSVVTTPARNADVTADLAFTLLLNTVRRVSEAERWLREGRWVSDRPYEAYETFRGMGLAGRQLGLVGLGAIGRRVAQRARCFGMGVVGYDPFADQADLGDLVRLTSLEDLLASSDVVSIHAPLNDATTGMIGAPELALMKPSAYLINAGRAAIIQEPALMAVLSRGLLAGAGFDVFWSEPLAADHPLLKLPNVVLTPHIGGASDDVTTNHSRQSAAALRAWLAGTELPNLWDR